MHKMTSIKNEFTNDKINLFDIKVNITFVKEILNG